MLNYIGHTHGTAEEIIEALERNNVNVEEAQNSEGERMHMFLCLNELVYFMPDAKTGRCIFYSAINFNLSPNGMALRMQIGKSIPSISGNWDN